MAFCKYSINKNKLCSPHVYKHLEQQADSTAATLLQRHYSLPNPPEVMTRHFGETSEISSDQEMY